MNKKITGIISGIIAFLAGTGIIVFNLNDEPDDFSTNESAVVETYSAETEPETEIITEVLTEEEAAEIFTDGNSYVEYHFRNEKLLNQHFEKHGSEFDYSTAYEYEKGASDVINNPDALFKTEAEDGDGVYYIEQSNEFVILSTDGYIRTYFKPSGGINYFNRQ
ncbi:MAG: hypothetical protein K2J40_08230 [Ruminococcus sp.]|nr:hypothetical protein [Ruminococcus sp.]